MRVRDKTPLSSQAGCKRHVQWKKALPAHVRITTFSKQPQQLCGCVLQTVLTNYPPVTPPFAAASYYQTLNARPHAEIKRSI